MRPVTSRITAKYTTKGLQISNGKMMFFDFPFKRPTVYNFQLADGCCFEVSEETYHQHRVGDWYTIEYMELSDYLWLFGAIVLTVLVVLGALYLI